MKRFLTILCLVLLSSCSPPTYIDENETVLREGIRYEKNSITPFNGYTQTYYYKEVGQRFMRKTTLKSSSRYKNGLRDGVTKHFYPTEGSCLNGGVYVVLNHKKGELDGVRETFSCEGVRIQREVLKKGKLTSDQRFDTKGNLVTDLKYVNEKREGLYTKWWSNGQLHEQGNYKNGEMDGTWSFYDNSGNLTSTQEWKGGVLQE